MLHPLSNARWNEYSRDDIDVFDSDFDQTLSNLAEICDRLREANLTCRPKNCELFRKKIAFLGHIDNDKGVECDPGKTEAICSWPVQTLVKEVEKFQGLADYYRRFVPKYPQQSGIFIPEKTVKKDCQITI